MRQTGQLVRRSESERFVFCFFECPCDKPAGTPLDPAPSATLSAGEAAVEIE